MILRADNYVALIAKNFCAPKLICKVNSKIPKTTSPNMNNLNVTQRLESLSILRGIFIMMIFFHHAAIYNGGGTLAVSFFFMLGGFALSYGYYNKVLENDFSYRQFITKRAEKFFPLHWLCLLAVLPFTFYSMWVGNMTVEDILALLPNALLLQSLIPIDSVYFSYNAVSWYLSDTVIFALLFPLIVKGIARLSIRDRVVMLAVVLLLYSLLVYFLPIEFRHAILYINPFVRIVDFTIGIYLYLVYQHLKTRCYFMSCCSSVGILIAILMIAISITISIKASEEVSLISAIYWLPLAILLIVCALYTSGVEETRSDSRLFWLFSLLGDISFPMFMIHQIVIRYLSRAFSLLHVDCKPLEVIMALIITILASLACMQCFLIPLSAYFKQRRNTKSSILSLIFQEKKNKQLG